MTASNQVIVTAYEDLGMTPEQIAEQESFDLTSVKSILMQCSTLYRKAMKKDASLDFTDEEAQEAKSILVSIMRYSEDEYLKARIASRLIDDKKGRLDVGKQMTGLNVHVNLFAQHMKQALEQVERAKQLNSTNRAASNPIDVEAVKEVEEAA